MIGKRNLLLSSVALAATETLFAGSERMGPGRALAHEHRGEHRGSRLPRNVVYIQSNIATDQRNSIIGYRRAADGTLTTLPGSPYPTGGRGFFFVTGPGPFDSDQEIVLDHHRGLIYAVNSGSSSVAALRIEHDGSLTSLPGSPYAIPGMNPISLGLRHGSLVVLNADGDPAQQVAGKHPTAIVATIESNGGLTALPSTEVTLPDGSQPTQVLTDNTGKFIFTCEFFGKKIRSFTQLPDGSLVQLDQQTLPQQAGATMAVMPLGLWAHDREPLLYVGFANTAQLGVYRWNEDGDLLFLRTVTNSGKAICWLRTAFNGARLYTVNAGDNSISVYDTTDPENPDEIQHLAIGGLGALVQFDITPDARFLYIIEQANSDDAMRQGNRMRVIAIDDRDGSIFEVTKATLRIDVPHNTIPQGVIAL